MLPVALAGPAADPVAWRQLLASLGRSALARVDSSGLLMHRLTQAIIRTSLPPDQAEAARDLAEAVLAASQPGDTDIPGTWPAWARLLPHLLLLNRHSALVRRNGIPWLWRLAGARSPDLSDILRRCLPEGGPAEPAGTAEELPLLVLL